MLAWGPPHGRPCCFALWPPSWRGVLCRCVAPLMVGHAVLVPVRRGCCAWCVAAAWVVVVCAALEAGAGFGLVVLVVVF